MNDEAQNGEDQSTETLYEAEVTDLKMKYRRRRVTIAALHVAFEVVIVFLVYSLGTYALLIYLILAITTLPTPFFGVPEKYRITSTGVHFSETLPFSRYSKPRFSAFKKSYRLKMNDKEMFVSIFHRFRGERLRLYTREPQKVHELLQKLISASPK